MKRYFEEGDAVRFGLFTKTEKRNFLGTVTGTLGHRIWVMPEKMNGKFLKKEYKKVVCIHQQLAEKV